MRTPYIRPIHRFDPEEQAVRVLGTLRFIVGCGGTVDRWRGFILLSKMPQAIFDVIEFLNVTSTPALEFLSLRWKGNLDVAETAEQDAMEDLARRSIPEDSLSLAYGPKRPQLRQVELNGLPNSFVFDRVSPMVSNLTKLTLIGLEFSPSIRGVSVLLSASARLESLCVDMGKVYRDFDHQETVPLAPYQVRLSSLRAFTLNIGIVHDWGLELLQIVDAPGLEYLELAINTPYYYSNELDPRRVYRYLGTGRVNGVLQCNIPPEDEPPNSGPIFPSLRHLNAERIAGWPSTIPLVLGAFPMVRQVTLSLECLHTLDSHPELLPSVSHFTLNRTPVDYIVRVMLAIASLRAQSGTRVKVFEISTCNSELWRPPAILGGKGGHLYQKHLIPLSRVVDKLEVRELEEQSVYAHDSDDDVIADTDEEDETDGLEESDSEEA